ncbi:hypothetical protein PMM47T1_24039 [Pseudomonas sp. M47T1]|uniref:hypothetical protein n=1 Tax=Pseudomonas sp. M47T1 TaxID=1179778 RepID=UPI00026068FA|nr:hypothetical protein [Pseudomonas sp. M47T1]EIK94020.1 hypothetical protein PMM47T1_24039 [Pseudomonas sp. M47T1]
MARRRSSIPELLMIKILSVLVIPVVGYYAVSQIMQTAFTQQIATIQAVNQQAQEQQQRSIEVARQQKVAAARAAQAANEQYIEEARRRGAAEQAKTQAWYASYQAPKGCNNWKTDTQMVACVEQENAAKQEFDRKWDAGLKETSQPTMR